MNSATQIVKRVIGALNLAGIPHMRRRSTSFDGEPTCIPTPEDVIVTKLRWARPKDVADVRDILRFMEPDAIDWHYLHRWTALHGTREALDKILASVSNTD